MKNKNIPPALFLVFSGFLAHAASVQAEDRPPVEPVPECFVQMPDTAAPHGGTDCGYVVVPQSRSGGPAGDIRLAYMRIRAATPTQVAPLFMIAGGPGNSMIKNGEMVLFQPELLGPVLAERDVVLMEQRGTFRSKPNLDCPEVRKSGKEAARAGIAGSEVDELQQTALRSCMERLEADGVDLASYNNVESARDVNDVRAALGYEKINLYGSSYATLLSQYVMGMFPDRLISVILDGTDTLTTRSWVENRGVSAQWGLDNMTRLCAAQPGCAQAYDIPAIVDAAFRLFDEGPIRTSVAASQLEVTITAEDFAAFVYQKQTSKFAVSALPLELTQMVAGGRELIAETFGAMAAMALAAEPAYDENSMTTLMHMAMVCTDDPPGSVDDIKLDNVGHYAKVFALAEQKEYVKVCGNVDLPQLPGSSDEPIRANVPVLVLSGGLDVQTPYFLSEQVVSMLPDAKHVIFPAGFHVQISNINRCAMDLSVAFLHQPDADLDPGCVANEQPLPFALPQDLEN